MPSRDGSASEETKSIVFRETKQYSCDDIIKLVNKLTKI